jgi:nucleoside-diphosphate-sugar epimerase
VKRHLVTGATGFIGGALVLELLRQTPDEVWCLVRADSSAAAWERLRAGLEAAAAAYRCPELMREVDARCRAVAGDIDRPLDAAAAEMGSADEVWHSAASLKYQKIDADEVRLRNVDGTRGVLEMAGRLGASMFNLVSTAYVAGRREGLIREEPPADGIPTNNVYERSKIDAEALVAASPLPHRILRPGIVIGHSVTRAAFSDFGLYGASERLLSFRRRVRQRLGAYMSHYRTQVIGDPNAQLNLVPVDFVTRNAVRISLGRSRARIFHLVNSRAPTVTQVCNACFNTLGMSNPELVSEDATYTSLDRALNRSLAFHFSYVKYPKVFDCAHTDAACGPEASRFPMDEPMVAEFLYTYLGERASDEPRRRSPGRAVAGRAV